MPSRDSQQVFCVRTSGVTPPKPPWRQGTHDTFAVESRVPELSADIRQRETRVADALIRIEANTEARQPGAEKPRKPDWQRQGNNHNEETRDPKDLEQPLLSGPDGR